MSPLLIASTLLLLVTYRLQYVCANSYQLLGSKQKESSQRLNEAGTCTESQLERKEWKPDALGQSNKPLKTIRAWKAETRFSSSRGHQQALQSGACYQDMTFSCEMQDTRPGLHMSF